MNVEIRNLPFPAHETPLLRAIRTALRGSDTENGQSIQTSTFFTGRTPKELELTWSAHAAVLSYAGVMVKRWSFDQEGESIQWACLGELEQQSTLTAKTANEADVEESTGTSTRPTFGPFARSQLNPKFNAGPAEVVPAVFIFLRCIGKIYLLNGVDYTFCAQSVANLTSWRHDSACFGIHRGARSRGIRRRRAAHHLHRYQSLCRGRGGRSHYSHHWAYPKHPRFPQRRRRTLDKTLEIYSPDGDDRLGISSEHCQRRTRRGDG